MKIIKYFRKEKQEVLISICKTIDTLHFNTWVNEKTIV